MPRKNRIKIGTATKYEFVKDICILTSYFNPSNYKTKKINFDKFINPIQQSGLNHIVVECSYNNGKYEIPDSKNIIRVNSNAILWQKERLLNIGLSYVPRECTKVIWVDSDILFTNPSWAIETSNILDYFPIVQPYERAIRLPKNTMSFSGEGLVYNGFAAVYNRFPNALLTGDFELHGHTGFAWAARKEILEESLLYDSCLSGVADHLMAHAFCGDWHSVCLKSMFLENSQYFNHFENWSNKIYEKVRGRVGYSKGTIFHLWHGNTINRRYLENSQFLSKFNFDPATDLFLNEMNCWDINYKNHHLTDWTKDYLSDRKED